MILNDGLELRGGHKHVLQRLALLARFFEDTESAYSTLLFQMLHGYASFVMEFDLSGNL